nr:Chain B, Histone-lysine N-methyltransferase NSD3 [Homo sapiens]
EIKLKITKTIQN